MALNRNTRSSRKEKQDSKHPKITESIKKKGKVIVTPAKQSSVKLITTVTKTVTQLNELNSLTKQKLKVSKGKSLSVKTSERLKDKVPAVKGRAPNKTKKALRKSSKMHNDQLARSRRSASQCCADCKLVVHKREQLRLRASLGIKLCDACWEKRNIKTPNRSQKSVITKSCEIKLVDILRTTDSSLNAHAENETTPVKRKRGRTSLADKSNKKLKLGNGANSEESETEKIETDLKTENLIDSNSTLQAESKEFCEDSEANKQSVNSDFQSQETDPLSSNDLKHEIKPDPDSPSTIETANNKEIHTPDAKTKLTKKSPGKITVKAKAAIQTNSGHRVGNTNNRASRKNSNLKTTNEDRGNVARSNLRITRLKPVNNKQLSGKIRKNISNLASSLRLKTRISSNENTVKTVKVPFKKKVYSKRLSNNEILQALNSVENVKISDSISSQRQNHKVLKGNKLQTKEVPAPKKLPGKRHEKSPQSYAVNKVKQVAANNKKSGRKERLSGSLFFCAVCNKDFNSYSETKLHEISHDGRYPVLILHRCDSAQGVLSLIREVDFPSYDSDPPVILGNGEVIKSDGLKEESSVHSKPSDSSPSKPSLSAENKATPAKPKTCSDTSKEPTEGKQDEVDVMLEEMLVKPDELVVKLEEMFGSCNEDSGSSNQAKDVGDEIKGITDSTALVEVLDESVKSEVSEINSANKKLKMEDNVNHSEDTKAQVVSVNDTDETKDDKNVEGNLTTSESITENVQSQVSLSSGSLKCISDHKSPDNSEVDKKSKDHQDVQVSTDESHNNDELFNLKSEDELSVPEDIEKLTVLKDEAKSKTSHDNQSQDVVVSGSEKVDEHCSQSDHIMAEEENCEVSDNKELSNEVKEDDLDKTDEKVSDLVELEKEVKEGETHINLQMEQDTPFCANTVHGDAQLNEIESKKVGLNDLTNSESKKQESCVSIENNESSSGEALQTEIGMEGKVTVNSDVKQVSENSETVNSAEKQLQNSKETMDEETTQSGSSSPSPAQMVDDKICKDISNEAEHDEILSGDKMGSANENNVPEDVDIQLSEGLQKTAEMSEDTECSSFKFDALEEPENSSRSSNGENLSDLIRTCESGGKITEDVSEAENVPAEQCVTENPSELQAASKCDDIDILIKEVLESNSLESDKSNGEAVTESLTDGGNNNNSGCVQNNTQGHLVSDETSLAYEKSSSTKADTMKGENVPLDDELNLEPVSDDEVGFI